MWEIIDELAEKKDMTRNAMTAMLIDYATAVFSQAPFDIYTIISDRYVAIYDVEDIRVVVVEVSPDPDEPTKFTCYAHIGKKNCEHILFVQQIPMFKQRLEEDAEEFGEEKTESGNESA